jgi:hypothetical protein
MSVKHARDAIARLAAGTVVGHANPELADWEGTVTRYRWVDAPLYRTGDLEALREHPDIDWEAVRGVKPFSELDLRELGAHGREWSRSFACVTRQRLPRARPWSSASRSLPRSLRVPVPAPQLHACAQPGCRARFRHSSATAVRTAGSTSARARIGVVQVPTRNAWAMSSRA